MKLTNKQLRQIIKEELTAVLRETGDSKNVDLWLTMKKLHNLISKGSGQLTTISEEDMSFDDGRKSLEGFSVSDAIKQLEGKPVKRGNKNLKQWKGLQLYDGFWLHKAEDTKAEDTEDVEGETDPEPTEEPEENKTPEEKHPILSQPGEVFFSLEIERPEKLEFHMRVILESGEEFMILEIEGQNVHRKLEEILSYFVIPKEDVLEMMNELMSLYTLPITSLP